MNRRSLAIVAIGVMIALSGCATVEVTAEVGDENTLDRYEVDISTSTFVYGLLDEEAQEDGYDGIEDQLVGDIDVDDDRIEFETEIDGDDARMSLEIQEVPASELDDITLEETDGMLRYTDTAFAEEADEPAEDEEMDDFAEDMLSGFVFDYTVIMPSEVTDSNADQVDGNTATWTETGADAFEDSEVYAESEAPSALSVPGFGVVPAVLAILSVVGMLAISRRSINLR